MDRDGSLLTTWKGRYRSRALLRKAAWVVTLFAAVAANVGVAYYLTNDQPDDGKLYSRIARNVLESGTFSIDENPPIAPSIIRLPGYPLVIAAVYKLFGVNNDTAVRVVQALMLVIASLFFGSAVRLWRTGSRRRRRKAAYFTFILAAFCPFTMIYGAVLLTEAPTILALSVAAFCCALAILADRTVISASWWAATGAAVGLGVELRPDSGLFALGFGITLLATLVICRREGGVIARVACSGLAFALAFVAVLTPWTIRNEKQFGQFQPLAPAHGEMPGEFVPNGYFRWLRTWVDDFKYVGPMLWALEMQRIEIKSVPADAFANDDERQRVADLFAKYNNSDPDDPFPPPAASDPDSKNENDDDADNGPPDDENDASDEKTAVPEELDLKMAPDVDAEFAKLADERIARDPASYYLVLPAKRAVSMWFDTHSEYYPFGGQLLPLSDLDNNIGQDIWLPVFASVMWLYTLLAVAGLALLFYRRNTRIWGIMVLAVAVPRVLFFSTLENPEPRYFVELFPLAAMLGGVLLSRLVWVRRNKTIGISLRYR